jgi:hypothetical protein
MLWELYVGAAEPETRESTPASELWAPFAVFISEATLFEHSV